MQGRLAILRPNRWTAAVGLAGLAVLLSVVWASANHYGEDGKLPQPFHTSVNATVVECKTPSASAAHGFEVDADIQADTVPGPAPDPFSTPVPCPGYDWSNATGGAGSGNTQAVFQLPDATHPNIATFGQAGNNPNVLANIGVARNSNFPTSAWGGDDNALSGNVDCSTHTNGDKVNDGVYSIVKGGSQPKADISNFYSVILSNTTPRTAIVGFERVTTSGDTHLNVAFKAKAGLLQGLGCPQSAVEVSSGWTIGDLIANVNYGGGTAQPTINVFKVSAVAADGTATLCTVAGASEGGIADCLDPSVQALAITNCEVVQVNNNLRCLEFNPDATPQPGSDISAGFWRSRICDPTRDNPQGAPAGCRDSSILNPPTAPGNGGHPESRLPRTSFIEVRLTGNVVQECFGTLQVQSRASGESVTSALSDVAEAAFPGCNIKIEKHDSTANGALIPGATYSIAPNPFACVAGYTPVAPDTVTPNGGIYYVQDGSAKDADPTGGKIQINGVCPATYTIIETVAPPGWGLNTTPMICTVSAANTTCSPLPVNIDPLGTIKIDKDDDLGNPLGGATFKITPHPWWCHSDTLNGAPTPGAAADGFLTVLDNNGNDSDPAIGKIQINRACIFGSAGPPITGYTIEETLAPIGFALADPASQGPTPLTSALVPLEISFDFDNRLGTIEWEKRDDLGALQSGAVFTILGNPYGCHSGSNPGDITDYIGVDLTSGTGDVDGSGGQFKLLRVCLGTYTITEKTAPTGFARDSDITRVVVVSATELNPVVGSSLTGTGTNDCADNLDAEEQDFCNRLGTLEWEKRDDLGALQGGATFSVSPNPFSCRTPSADPSPFVDNAGPDADADAGQIKLNRVCMGTYTITETVAPTGFARDSDFTRVITVGDPTINAANELNPVVGGSLAGTGINDCANSTSDERDFCNRLGTIEWEKRLDNGAAIHPLQGGATFSVTPNPFGCRGGTIGASLTDNESGVDGGSNLTDQDGTAGQWKLIRVCMGTYTITELTVPLSTLEDPDDTRVIVVGDPTVNAANELNPVVGSSLAGLGTDDEGTRDAQAVCTDEECDFHNRQMSIIIRKVAKDASQGAGLFPLGGACFDLTPNPFTGDGGPQNVCDVSNNVNPGVQGDRYFATAGLICLDNVVPLGVGVHYSIQESSAPTGYKIDPAAHNVDPSFGSCSSRIAGTPANKDIQIENIPLSQIEVIFSSLAGAGKTVAAIECKQGATVIAAVSENGGADPAFDDTDEVFTNLGPATSGGFPITYTCTIVIDP